MSAKMKRLSWVFRKFEVGSTDWTWREEMLDLFCNHAESMILLLKSIQTDGIKEPILLGDDGRVWDGHHRLTCAWLLELKTVPVVFAKDLQKESADV